MEQHGRRGGAERRVAVAMTVAALLGVTALVLGGRPVARSSPVDANRDATPGAVAEASAVAAPAPPEEDLPAVGPPAPWSRYPAFRGPTDASLVLHALNLNETARVRPFDDDGAPDPEAFAEIARVMRCRRSDRERPIDPRLVVLLSDLQARFDAPTLHLVSGYRVPDGAHTTPTSFHVRGMAADVRVPGVGPGRLYVIAERLGAGGVGLYPRRTDRFVHVDVREDAIRWRQKWNRRNAYRAVRHAAAHRERLAAWPLPP